MRTKSRMKLRLLVSVSILLASVFSMLNNEAAATQAKAGSPVTLCSTLTGFNYNTATIITSATLAAAGTVSVPGIGPMPEHCIVKGYMNKRTSPVDEQTYQIGFEMRLPTDWNGRYFYQANGGIDGSVVSAYGVNLGGAPTSNGLLKGFAVISSDAGHQSPAPFFGIDPQARIDYGYNTVAQLTPMAKSLITTYYGKLPEKSYFVGCSNGGRHAMVAASRYADQYDGILAGAPGFNLPKAAVSQLWGAQQYATISPLGANGYPDIGKSFSSEELTLVGNKILTKCDGLDGLLDDMVTDPIACQAEFNLDSDVPTCKSGDPAGTCLTNDQKAVLADIFAGAKNSAGQSLYTDFLWDVGIKGSNWKFWEHSASTTLDPGAVAFIFTTPPFITPPQNPFLFNGLDYAFNSSGKGFSPDTDAPKIFATSGIYTESAMSFMTPPNLAMPGLITHDTKLMVMHGVSDAVFSAADTIDWYENFRHTWGNRAMNTARLFLVPQMNHCSGGPSCDQFDMIDVLVKWVEQGIAPESVVAKARGTGANIENGEVPAPWAPNRTRLLCPYPAVARFVGGPEDSIEDAKNFLCPVPTDVRIEPETFNLKSRGVFTAFISFPPEYPASAWQITKVVCAGATNIRGTLSENSYIAKFNRQDVQDITPGQDEFICQATATNPSTNQTVLFEGTDTVRVIRPPIIWRNTATGENVVWYMNGATQIGEGRLATIRDQSWQIVGTGDFNNDGKPDIIWRNLYSGATCIWYMNSANQIGEAWLPNVGTLWKIVGIADFNGDDKPDILWRNTAYGHNVIWFMNGATQMGEAWLATISDQRWQIVGTGDFNNDGKPDILWRSATHGRNIVWYMNSGAQIGEGNLDTVSDQNWQIVGTSDFDGDGKPDILWRNTANGQNIVWYMDGAKRTSSEYLTTIPDLNWKIVGM